MNWLLLAGSLISVLALAGIAHALGLGGDARIADRDAALALAAQNNFDAADIALDKAGLAALARDAAGRFLLIRRHGVHFIGERVTTPLDARLDQRFLTLGKTTLDLGDEAAVWAASLRRLA